MHSDPLYLRFLIGCRMLLMMTSCFYVIISGTEYCLNQSFEATCGPHEIVMVHQAYYGRMRLGTCVQRDYGSKGCKADVTEILTGACSGKDACKIVNMEAFFSKFNMCPSDLKSYLDVNVTCLPVQRLTCSTDGLIHLTGQGTNVISGSVPMVMSSGAEFMVCPYVLEAKPGQRINITLSDFFELSNQDDRIDDSMETKLRPYQQQQQSHEDDEHLCKKYVTIWDGSEVKNLVMCRRNAEVVGRLESVYVSMSNKVKLKIEAGIKQRFIITYNVIGCPFPDLPYDSHIQLGRDTRWPTAMTKITISCNQSEDSIVLTCKNGVYVTEHNQDVINCTRKLPQGLPEDWTSNSDMKSFFPYGISMLLVAVVATCICLITLAIGLLYVNRKDRRMQNARKLTSLMNGGSVPFDMIAIPGAYDLSTDTDIAKGATYPTSKKGSHFDYPYNRRPECQYSPVTNRNWHGAHGTMTPSSPERRLLIPQDTSTIKMPSPIMSTTTSHFRGNLPLPHIPMDRSSDTIIMSDVCSEPSSCLPSTALTTPPTIRCSCTMPKQMNKNRVDVLPGVIKKLNTERKNRKPSFDSGTQKRSNFFTTINATKPINQKPIKHDNPGNVPSSSPSSNFFSPSSSTTGPTSTPTFSTFKPVDVVESCVSVQNRSNNNNNDNFPQHFCSQNDPDWSGMSGNSILFQTSVETTRNNPLGQRQCPTPKSAKSAGVRFTLTSNDKHDEHRAYKMADKGSALV